MLNQINLATSPGELQKQIEKLGRENRNDNDCENHKTSDIAKETIRRFRSRT